MWGRPTDRAPTTATPWRIFHSPQATRAVPLSTTARGADFPINKAARSGTRKRRSSRPSGAPESHRNPMAPSPSMRVAGLIWPMPAIN
ncbi:MAG: hypothetical protein Dbin4_01200 [Alphaproteobacteria bacterium]|nr:hypothetical protein [Alphaproteobacteria bacterium]